MCGIVAALSRRAPLERGAIERATDAMAERGPDGRGLWLSHDRTVALGHRRLAVMAPRSPDQPLTSEDRLVHAVVNGEFYDTAALRAELERRGHRFASDIDSELLVHAYEEYGLDALRRLRGEFAFALWSERERALVLGRDRFGVKPLYYATSAERVIAASRVAALFAAGVPARWDEAAFFQAASLQYPSPGSTLYDGVRQLEPGTLLVVGSNEERQATYWDLDYPSVPVALSPADAAQQFRERFEDAVAVRLVADAPIAFQLSGGIDSASVVACAARRLGAPLDCFTVSFEHAAYDERELASAIARHVGARLHVVAVSELDVQRELPRAVAFSEGLSINGHLVAKFLLSRAVRDAGFKVVLTGEGSDEVLAGYAHLRADLDASRAHELSESNEASRGIMLPSGEGLDVTALRARLGYVPTWLAAKATFGYRVRQVLRRDWLERFAACEPFAVALSAIDVAGQLRGRSRVEQSSYLWSKFALESYILRTLGDAMEMAHSVEGRVPFLDHHLFEWARTLPVSVKIRDGVEKAPLRDAMRTQLPEVVARRQKHPFLAPPLFSSERAPLAQALLACLAEPSARSLPFFDRERLRGVVSRLPALAAEERAALDPVLMFALNAYLLHAHFRL